MSDLYTDDYDVEDTEQEPTRANNPVADLRAKIRRLEKEAKERNTELEELRQFRVQTETTTRKSAVSTAFASLGLPEAYAELYPADAEGSPEAVKAFALKYGWVTPEAAEPSDEEVAAPAPTFRPVTPDGSAPATRTVKAADLLKMSPKEAQAAIAQGRVEDLDVVPGSETYDW